MKFLRKALVILLENLFVLSSTYWPILTHRNIRHTRGAPAWAILCLLHPDYSFLNKTEYSHLSALPFSNLWACASLTWKRWLSKTPAQQLRGLFECQNIVWTTFFSVEERERNYREPQASKASTNTQCTSLRVLPKAALVFMRPLRSATSVL